MLSFDTVHAITDSLLDLHRDPTVARLSDPPVLVVLHDQPVTTDTDTKVRYRTITTTYVPHAFAPTDTRHIDDVLHRLAGAYRNDRTTAPDPTNLRHLFTASNTGAPVPRLLAWALLYHDVSTDGSHEVHLVRRVDAIDTDARVYQVTRLRHEPHPFVVIDEEPDAGAIPATQPALSALLGAFSGVPATAPR